MCIKVFTRAGCGAQSVGAALIAAAEGPLMTRTEGPLKGRRVQHRGFFGGGEDLGGRCERQKTYKGW